MLAAILFALRAWGYQISVWDLMYSPRGVAFGASYADIHAQVPAFKILIFAALLGAALSVASLYLRTMRFIGYSAVTLIALSLAVGYAYPAFMQNFTVSPNELAYELPFIEHNINFTRHALGINDIESVPFEAANDITQKDLEENSATIRNFRLWDYRMYYKFNDVDVDRYTVNGELRLALSSARELDISSLPPEANSWINIHLKYTHGYGIVMSPASEVTRDGMPAFYLQDIPPRPSADLSVTRPEIYFGELTDHYIIVNTKEPEFDYPRTETETLEPTFYQGKAGVPVGGFLRRLLFMLRFRDYQVLVSGALTPESRVVMRRNIMERVRTIAPFLMYDSDPYVVTADGRLYWMLDAYTVSANYPYSQPDAAAGVNYIRNSVKVVIDAYDGTTTFYQADSEDPIINTYAKIFPDFLTPISEMPESLKSHIRYPEDLFKIQSRALLTYHMTDPHVYYNKEDYWELPREIYGTGETAVSPYYIVLDVPNQSEPEYMLMTSFTPRGKPNMTAWLGIRCDLNEYGKATLYAVPKDELIPGPMQVESLFSQNPQIAANMTLWGQRGSQVIRGNLLIYPVGDSLLYMEPLYLQAETVRIPELKLVLMYYGGKVVMGTSVADAMSQLFGKDLPLEPPDGVQPGDEPEDVAGLVARANTLWQQAQEALRAGDWAGYGKAIEELGRVLMELGELTGAAAVELETPPPEAPVP